VVAVEGDPHNVKITTAEDLALAEWLIDAGRVGPPAGRNGPIGSV
jgi:2-C-methyl-D-erythritol 4-phosphate cytidylyltransferase